MMYLRTTSFSTNLERIGVTDIGRRSEVLTAAVLGTGVTRAVFHEEGGVPVCNMVLKRTVTTGVNSIAQCLKTQYGIESCPGLVFLTEGRVFHWVIVLGTKEGFLVLGRGTAKDLQSLFRHSSSNRSVCKYQIQVVW